MMTVTHKEIMDPAIELMNRVLRSRNTVVDEFPLVFRSGFSGQVVSIGDDDGIRSACTILMRDAICPDAHYGLGLIGSVSTDSAFRRGGLATNVLIAAEERLAEQGAIISMLWADDPRFYFARGYRPIGGEHDFLVDDDLITGLPDLKGIRVARSDDSIAIHELYDQHSTRLNRTPEETEALLECPGMTTLVHEKNQKVLGYACMGRGEDLEGTVHEWGGAITSVLGLFRAHAESRTAGDPTCLIAPINDSELAERLNLLGIPPIQGLLGLAKIIDRGGAARLLDELLGDQAEVTFDPDAPEIEQVEFITQNGTVHLNDDTLLVLLFSSKGERTETEAFGRNFGITVDRLPLQTFVWGLDSI